MRRSSPFSLVSVVTLSLASNRNGDLPKLPALRLSDGGTNVFDPRPRIGPSPGEQHDDGQSSACEVLLAPDALVGGYQQLVAFILGNIQQVSVAQLRPPSPRRRVHSMFEKEVAERSRSPLVKQDFQGCLPGLPLSGNQPRVAIRP